VKLSIKGIHHLHSDSLFFHVNLGLVISLQFSSSACSGREALNISNKEFLPARCPFCYPTSSVKAPNKMSIKGFRWQKKVGGGDKEAQLANWVVSDGSLPLMT